MLTDAMPQDEIVIACDPNAIPEGQRQRWIEVGLQMYGAVQEVKELSDGYALRLPNEPSMLLLMAEDVNNERLCCPFVRYAIEVEPNRGPFWLRVTGGAGVKDYLRAALETTTMLNEQVAEAAGFSIASRTEINSWETTVEVAYTLNQPFAKD